MPELGNRFTTVDPHAENYYGWSPYHYGANNPIRVTDPTGMDWFTNDWFEIIMFMNNLKSSGSWDSNLDGWHKFNLDNILSSDEKPINLFSPYDSRVFHDVVKSAIYRSMEGDRKFSVYGHGDHMSVGSAGSVEELYNLLCKENPMFKKYMDNNEFITVMLYSCNAASKDYITGWGEHRTSTTTIAEEFSKTYPNVLLMAANGHVVYSEKRFGPLAFNPHIEGIRNYRNDGCFIFYYNGIEISRLPFPVSSE